MKRSQEGFLLRLPQKLTLETVPSLFSTISSQSPQTQGSLKAEGVETIDSSGAALLRWVKRTYPGLSLEGLNPDQARSLELFPSPPPAFERTKHTDFAASAHPAKGAVNLYFLLPRRRVLHSSLCRVP